MATGFLSPIGMILQLLSDQGVVGAGFKINTYLAGSVNTPVQTYTDSTLATPNANPIVMGSNGRLPNVSVWAPSGTLIKMVITDTNNNPLAGGTIDNIPLINDVAVVAAFAQTSAEIAAGVTPTNFGYPPYDLRRYGADPSGVAASDNAMTQAIAVCGATGGTIRAPNGKYTFAASIAMNIKRSIIVQGDGSATGGAQPATQIVFTGSGAGIFIDMRSSTGCGFRDCQIVHNNAGFTGTYVKCGNDGSNGDPAFCFLTNCVLGSSVNGVGNVHLDLDKCTQFTATGCDFLYGNPSVKGQSTAGGSYSNVIRFRDCQWVTNYVVPINSQGQAWLIEGCTFENLTTGSGGALAGATAANNPTVGLVFQGNWLGDVQNSAPAATWIDGCFSGCAFKGNYFSGNVTSNAQTGFALRQSSAVAIIGNSFNSMLVAINFATGACTGVRSEANIANTVGTIYTGTGNIAPGQLQFGIGFGFGIPTGHGQLAQNGYRIHPDGSIEQWGLKTAVGTGNATVVWPLVFPTGCLNAVASMSALQNGNACVAPQTLGTATGTFFVADAGLSTNTTDSFYWRAIGN